MSAAKVRSLRSRISLKIEIPTINEPNVTSEPKNTKLKSETSTADSAVEGVKSKKQSVKPEIKIELIESVKSESQIDDRMPTSDLIPNQIEFKPKKKKSKSPRKRKQPETGVMKSEKVIKTDLSSIKDIEDIWQPENWREVLDNILKMRKQHVAPVDSLGCEECPEKDAQPEVFRYQTLISVMLSSQTKDEVTHAATQRLIAHGLTIDSILATPDERIGQLIYPAGFWKTKVKFIKNTTQILKDQYSGDIPRNFRELCMLPGVGPKMAHIVMSVAWDDTVGIAVDTHVHRISNRLGWVPKPTKEPEETRSALEKWLPKDEWKAINVTLVGFGQTICRPVGPNCEKCFNSNLCPFGRSVLSGRNKKKKPLK
ncbi:hypothetical protein CEXT_583291 [Caerostris extrusa]|uniref:Endonuclease III homolog n=1 Tax=Caerostris extrusa TaxID=172846 RepID=A0AAV4Q952_CAEEX|nr:hypothetical protein CEXT_583291 [Caerostris extrusa]